MVTINEDIWRQVDDDIAFKTSKAEPAFGMSLSTSIAGTGGMKGWAAGDAERAAGALRSDNTLRSDNPLRSGGLPGTSGVSRFGLPPGFDLPVSQINRPLPDWVGGVAKASSSTPITSTRIAGFGDGGQTLEARSKKAATRSAWRDAGELDPDPLPQRLPAKGRAVGSGPSLFAGERPVTRPMSYDGETSLNEYLNHFDLCVAINSWTPEQAGAFLGVSLSGTARRLLEGLRVDTEAGYIELRKRLRGRFEPENATGTYKAKLRAIERGADQSISAFASDVLDLVRRAYPTMSPETQEVLAKDRFVDALGDAELRLWVWQAQPTTLNRAVAVAIEGETCLTKERVRRPTSRLRMVTEASETKEPDDGPMNELLQMVRQISSSRGGRGGRGGGGPRRGVCYRCQQSGHFARECVAPAPVPRGGYGSGAPVPPPAAVQPVAPTAAASSQTQPMPVQTSQEN